MTQNQNNNSLIKFLGVGAITLLINHIITSQRKHKNSLQSQKFFTQELIQSQRELLNRQKSWQLKQKKKNEEGDKQHTWGCFRISRQIKEDDALLQQLKEMDSLLFQVERINNLIIDLGFKDFQTIRSPVIRWQDEQQAEGAYMNQNTVITPGQFVIKQCVFKPGQSIELQKKFMKAGPRATQYFNPQDVRADIVCLGGLCPGMNTVVRQLTYVLINAYKVDKVYGIKESFKGYYQNQLIQLTPKKLETIHHFGGCYLGLCNTEFNIDKILDSLQKRNINQLYLIGGHNTLNAAKKLYDEIKKKRLNLAMTVILKGVNKDVPIFDTCFGFETASQQASKTLEKSYAFSHTLTNGISMLRLPGKNTGYLAAQAILSTINANVCLIPQIPFDLYGENGLLNFIVNRMKAKGNCTIVYTEGVQKGIRDCCIGFSQKDGSIERFQSLLKSELSRMMTAEKIVPYNIGIFNAVGQILSTSANSIDTKLCCQIAQTSIHGLMCGYTNFAIGHLASKTGMVPIEYLINSGVTMFLKQNDAIWQRVLGATGQPNFLNNSESSV